jgi:hypothetical protein
MSMVCCEKCDRLIDSDEDGDCFVEIGNMRRLHKEVVWCEWCREEHEVETDRHA